MKSRAKKKYTLSTLTDIKVFLLFLLANIGSPLDHSTLIEIVYENTDEIAIDYDECLNQLVDTEHVYFDEVGGEKYYMISKKGMMVASELYDTLDGEFRERSIRSAAKHLAFSGTGRKVESSVRKTDEGRFLVTMSCFDALGETMKLEITVASKSEAEKIKANFDQRPDSIYRGVLYASSGRMEYMS
jgi:predicted AAA+ superfamily ATPase